MPSVGLVNEMNLSVNDIVAFARVCTTPLDKDVIPEGPCSPEQYEKNVKLVKSLYKKGHLSVFEHSQMTFLVTCSRACSLQLARHRHISRTEMSQRYVKTTTADQFVIPPSIKDSEHEAFFIKKCQEQLAAHEVFVSDGIKPEDARFLLPEATKTRMFITLNLRTLLELRDKRMNNPGAQWEIRELVRQMWDCLPDDLKDCLTDEDNPAD